MLLDSLQVDVTAFETRTGWDVKPEGLCRGDVCLPLPADAVRDDKLDAGVLAARTGMPLVHDEGQGLWALGPPGGGRALASADAPELELPDLRTGEQFQLSSLRGQKVLLLAWASW